MTPGHSWMTEHKAWVHVLGSLKASFFCLSFHLRTQSSKIWSVCLETKWKYIQNCLPLKARVIIPRKKNKNKPYALLKQLALSTAGWVTQMFPKWFFQVKWLFCVKWFFKITFSFCSLDTAVFQIPFVSPKASCLHPHPNWDSVMHFARSRGHLDLLKLISAPLLLHHLPPQNCPITRQVGPDTVTKRHQLLPLKTEFTSNTILK